MSTEKIYEANPEKPYAKAGQGHVVSRTLYGAVLRGDMPLNCGLFGEVIEIDPPTDATVASGKSSMRVHVDTVPQDTIATSPDAALAAATVMQGLSNGDKGQLGFKVEYSAD